MIQTSIAAGLAFAAGAALGVFVMLPDAPEQAAPSKPMCLAMEELPDAARECARGERMLAVANTCPAPTEIKAHDGLVRLVLEPAGRAGSEFLGCLREDPQSAPWTP